MNARTCPRSAMALISNVEAGVTKHRLLDDYGKLFHESSVCLT